MSTKVLVRIIIASVILVLISIIYFFRSDILQNSEKTPDTISTIQDSIDTVPIESPLATDRLKDIENTISKLEKTVTDQKSLIDDLSEKNELSATKSATIISGKKIIATAFIKGSPFSTTSTAFSTMNVFVNITCPSRCILWANFYTTSKNDSANNVNSYGVFLNGQDQSINSQATFPVANGPQSISLNSAIPAVAGSYTIEVRAKTSGGTLQSEASFLQVLAVEN